ncbi:alpha-galactosidase [Arcanobacterium hippocoleae]
MAMIPSVVHVCTSRISIVFDLSLPGLPRIAYWGKPLAASKQEDITALVAANREAADGNQPNGIERYGITPLESSWWPGHTAFSGFRGAGADWSPRFQLTDFGHTSNDVNTANDGTFLQISTGKIVITAQSAQSALELRYEIEIFSEGPWRIRCCLKNLAASQYHLQELGVALPLPLTANEILDTAGRWGKERTEQRTPVNIGCRMREGRHGRTGFDAPGFTFVGEKGFDYQKGEIWGLHNAWSGNHRVWVEKMLNGIQVIGAAEILAPGEIILNKNESYNTPWFYACYANGLDDAAQQVQSWFRARENHPQKPRPVTLNVWEAVYFNHDLQKLQELAKAAAALGVERFVLDDGWFLGRRNDSAGLGDWYPDPDIWPNGLTPLVDYVHKLGMEFGLWLEPEMINEDSELARAHPEWILAAQGAANSTDLPVQWRNQQVLNLTVPQAYSYVLARIDALISEYRIAFIKWDHNRDLIEAGSMLRDGAAAIHAQTLALYRLLDELKSRHPHLEIESCSSGGARVDLEILQHTDRFWASDCIDPVERLPMMRAYAQIAPPELLGAHVASPFSHTTGRYSPLSMRAGTAIFGSFGIEWDILSASEKERCELAEWIDFYKKNRAFLHRGTVVRCNTPDPTLSLHGVVAADGNRGIFQLTTCGRAPVSPRGRIRFAGLNPQKHYRLRPIIIGIPPAGLAAPPWFGAADGKNYSGIVTTGEILGSAGVQVPRIYPEQSLIFEVRAEEN